MWGVLLRLHHPPYTMIEFKKVKSGEWQQPIRRGYKMACCDCGLVHRMNFRIVTRGDRHWIQFQAFRDGRLTKSGRLRLLKGETVEFAQDTRRAKGSRQ